MSTPLQNALNQLVADGAKALIDGNPVIFGRGVEFGQMAKSLSQGLAAVDAAEHQLQAISVTAENVLNATPTAIRGALEAIAKRR